MFDFTFGFLANNQYQRWGSRQNSLTILFSGDTLFLNSIGRTDLPGGDSGALIKSIKDRLLLLPEETTCIPGHGPITSLYHEKKNNPYL